MYKNYPIATSSTEVVFATPTPFEERLAEETREVIGPFKCFLEC
jgi:hypothetical protein